VTRKKFSDRKKENSIRMYKFAFFRIFIHAMNRTRRLMILRRLLSVSQVTSQEEMLEMLKKQGIKVTQATLSRDLKVLGAAKKADPAKGYVYVLPDSPVAAEENQDRAFPLSGFLWLKFSGHLGVIRTTPGFAAGIAALIDRANACEILATLAGDDTVLVIPAEGVKENEVRRALVTIMPELQDKIK